MVTTATPSLAQHPSLLRNRAFLTVVVGQSVSRMGDALLSLASVWLVLQLTDNNPLATSAALACEFLPYILFGVLAGALVDRRDRRRTMIWADSLRGAVLIAVPVLHTAGELRVWHIFAASFALSSLGRLFTPARQAWIPELVLPQQLVRANSISEGAGQAGWVVGPALGGVLVGVIGAENLYYLDAATFVFSAATLLTIRPRPAGGGVARRGGLRQEAFGGVRYVREQPVLVAALLLSAVATVTFAPVTALLPVLVRGDFDAGARLLGVLMVCFFAGSIAGSAVTARWGERLHPGRTMVAAIFGLGIATLALALAPSPVVAGTVLLVLGGVAAAFNVAEYSLLQQRTPSAFRGRVFAVSNVAAQILRPPALLAAGVVGWAVDVRVGLGMFSLAALAVGLVGACSGVLRRAP